MFYSLKICFFFIWLAHGFLLPHLCIHVYIGADFLYQTAQTSHHPHARRYLTNLGYITNPVDCIFCTRHIILFVLCRRNRYNCVDINGHYGYVHNLLFPPIKIYFIGYIVNVAPTIFFSLFLLVSIQLYFFIRRCRYEFTFLIGKKGIKKIEMEKWRWEIDAPVLLLSRFSLMFADLSV